MLNAKFKSRANRTREMRENLSIIIASQKSKLPPLTAAPQYAIRSGKVTLANVPKLAESRGPQTSVRVRGGWHSIHSTLPVVRNPIQPTAPIPNFRQHPYTPFLCRQVQGPNALLPPPQTPRPTTGPGILVPSTPQQTPKSKSNSLILQSPWVSRAELSTDFVNTTKQYTIKQLVDILCGDAEDIPTALKEPITKSVFKCPLGVGMEAEAARKRKIRKVSFNNTVEMPSIIFPFTPFQDTTNRQHIPRFTPIWDQEPDKSKRMKIDACPLVLTPPKTVPLFSLDENDDEDDSRSIIAETVDMCFEPQYFSPTKFKKAVFGEAEPDVSPLTFYRRAGGTGKENPVQMELTNESETTSSWFHNVEQSPINRRSQNNFIPPTHLSQSQFSTNPQTPSRDLNSGQGHGLDFIREMYHTDESPSQPFPIYW